MHSEYSGMCRACNINYGEERGSETELAREREGEGGNGGLQESWGPYVIRSDFHLGVVGQHRQGYSLTSQDERHGQRITES